MQIDLSACIHMIIPLIEYQKYRRSDLQSSRSWKKRSLLILNRRSWLEEIQDLVSPLPWEASSSLPQPTPFHSPQQLYLKHLRSGLKHLRSGLKHLRSNINQVESDLNSHNPDSWHYSRQHLRWSQSHNQQLYHHC